MPGKFERYKDKGGRSRVCLEAANAQVVGTSGRCGSERACENGIRSVEKNAADARVEDPTG